MAAPPTASWVVAIVLAVFFIFAAIFIWIAFMGVGRLWLQAMMSGTPVTVFEILGMRLRRVDASVVVKALIMARQGGVVVTRRAMETAYLQGVDLEKLVLAMIHAKKQGMETTFDELVAADLENRLAEKLERQSGTASGMASARGNASTAVETAGRSVRICKKCSKQVTDDSKICRNCGAIL